MQEFVDVRAVADLAHAAGAKVVVDNVFGTPVFSRPLELGADVVVYSATKHIDGQGRVLGGAVLGTEEFIDGPVKNLMRHTGPAMSPFNAWVLVKGLETLSLRVNRQRENAIVLATALETHPRVTTVLHPWLPSHPQHDLARSQMGGGGSVVTFVIDGGKDEAFRVMNALEVVDISNNLGDAKSLVTHPATTTHRRLPRRRGPRSGSPTGRSGSRSGWRTPSTLSRTSSPPSLSSADREHPRTPGPQRPGRGRPRTARRARRRGAPGSACRPPPRRGAGPPGPVCAWPCGSHPAPGP